jgi:hypothetical protein
LEKEPLGLLEVRIHVPVELEEELNAWYELEHIPQLLSVPGIVSATRYSELEHGTKMYRAFYELRDEQVILSEEFNRLITKRTPWSTRLYALYDNQYRLRNTYRLLATAGKGSHYSARCLYCFKADVAPEVEQDFNDWYDKEHLEAMAGVPGCVSARRFVSVEGQQKYMALYDLESPDVVNSEAWQKAANTSWTAKIRPHFRNPAKGYYELIRPMVSA